MEIPDFIKGSPLKKDRVTVASRVMLPTYALAFLLLGLNYLITPVNRLSQSPGLKFADGEVMPIQLWGVLFLISGVLSTLALFIHRRDIFRFALYLGRIVLAIWVVIFLLAALFSDASPTAAIWPWIAMRACKASELSLRKEEVT